MLFRRVVTEDAPGTELQWMENASIASEDLRGLATEFGLTDDQQNRLQNGEEVAFDEENTQHWFKIW